MIINNIISTYNSLNKIANFISSQDKSLLIKANLFTFISTFFDVLTIASLYPFLSFIFIDKGLVDKDSSGSVIKILDNIFNNISTEYLIPVYIIAVILSSSIKIYVTKYNGEIIAKVANNLATKVFRNIMVDTSIESNSSRFIGNIIMRSNAAMGAIINITSILSSFFMVTGILLILILNEANITILCFILIFLIYIFVGKLTTKNSIKNSFTIDNLSIELLTHGKQTIGNLKNIIIENRINTETNHFKNIDLDVRLARLSNHLINSIPRTIIEALIIIFILALSYYSFFSSIDFNKLVPSVALFLVTFQKIIPSVNTIYVNYSNILQSQGSINELLNQIVDLNVDMSDSIGKLDFKEMIILGVTNTLSKNVGTIHLPVNLTLIRGDRCLLRGISGIGKSTFLETLIGLREPTLGTISINGEILSGDMKRRWWDSISYIPQSPYIFNKSIFYNITLESNNSFINWNLFAQVVDLAKIAYIINDYRDLQVLEDGANLSGGEKQRILLARALYSQRKILFCDESMNGIHSQLRRKILTSIFNNFPDLTVVFISHNLEDSDLFNKVLVLEK